MRIVDFGFLNGRKTQDSRFKRRRRTLEVKGRSQWTRHRYVSSLDESNGKLRPKRVASSNLRTLFQTTFKCTLITSLLPFEDREVEVVEHGFFKRFPSKIRIGDAADGSLDDAGVGGAKALEGSIPADLVP